MEKKKSELKFEETVKYNETFHGQENSAEKKTESRKVEPLEEYRGCRRRIYGTKKL